MSGGSLLTRLNKGNPCLWVHRYGQTGQRMIDIGAHAGFVTKTMLEVVGPTGHVWGIEPMQAWTKAPRANLTWCQAAAGSQEGMCEMYPSGSASTRWLANLIAVTHHGHEAPQPLWVPVHPVDDLITVPVHLIKIDAQGAEDDVLHGMTRHLSERALLILELWPHGLAGAGSSARALIDWLEQHDYVCRWQLNDDLVPMDADGMAEWLASCNEHTHINIVAHPKERSL